MRNYLSLIFFFVFHSLIIAQQDLLDLITESEDTLTIEQAINTALDKNPQLNQLRQKIEGKKSEFWGLFGLQSPTLTYFKEGVPLADSRVFSEKRISLIQNIDFPLKSFFKLKSNQYSVKSLEFQYQAEVFKLKSEVKKAYVEVLYWIEIMKLRKISKDLAKSFQTTTQEKFETGSISELELMNADILLSEAENDFIDAQMWLNKARYNLFNLIGLNPEEQKYSLRFTDSLSYFNFHIPQKEILSSLQDQPIYLSKAYELNSIDYLRSQNWSSLLPDIYLNYYRQNYSSKFDHYGIEVGLKVPLWFMFDQRSQIQQSEARYQEAIWNQKETLLMLKKDIEYAWHSYETSQFTIENFRNKIGPKADSLLQLSLEAYKLGQIDFLRLLNVQNTFISSKNRYLTALKDYYINAIELEKYLRRDIVFSKQRSENDK